MTLHNQTQNKVILSGLKVASTFTERLVGMMGRKDFAPQYGLWIKKCNSVQTTFMKTKIDVIFIDKKNTVQKIIWDMKPWRFSPFVWAAESVIEIPSGRVQQSSVNEGDVLHVES